MKKVFETHRKHGISEKKNQKSLIPFYFERTRRNIFMFIGNSSIYTLLNDRANL